MGNQYREPDYWSRKAFSEGYPARSVYKLEEMQKKFNLFGKTDSVLDLGAAPGSWTTFLLRFLSPEGRVCAVDLQPLSESIRDPRLSFFQGDLTGANMAAAVSAMPPPRPPATKPSIPPVPPPLSKWRFTMPKRSWKLTATSPSRFFRAAANSSICSRCGSCLKAPAPLNRKHAAAAALKPTSSA